MRSAQFSDANGSQTSFSSACGLAAPHCGAAAKGQGISHQASQSDVGSTGPPVVFAP